MSTSTAKRSFVRLPRERRMGDIESAAREVFSERGYAAAAMSEIAVRAGVVEGTIYKYYENKRDLMLKVLQVWYESMIAEYKAKLLGVEGTRPRLYSVIWQHLSSIKANPDLCRLFYAEVRSAEQYYESDLYRLNREYTHVLMDIVNEGVARGELRENISVPLIRDVIFGAIEHHVTAFLAGRGDFDQGEVARQLTDMVMSGISLPAKAPAALDAAVERLEQVATRLDRATKPES